MVRHSLHCNKKDVSSHGRKRLFIIKNCFSNRDNGLSVRESGEMIALSMQLVLVAVQVAMVVRAELRAVARKR